jgi:hypothetical protein
LQAQLIATQLLEVPLLISQLGTTSLLFEQPLTLEGEVLSTLQFLPIACYALLLLLLPVALTPIVVPITVAAISSATCSITFPLLLPRGVLLLLPLSLLPPTLLTLLRLTCLLLALLLPTRFAFLGLPLVLTLLLGTLSLLVLTLDIAALFLRLPFALTLLFPALLAFLAVLLLLLTLLLPTLLPFLAVTLLFQPALLPPLLRLGLLFASAFGLLRWRGCLGGLPFFAILLAVLAATLALLLSLFSLGLVLLAPLITSATSPLSIDKVGGAQ